jgi:hypothetical protein
MNNIDTINRLARYEGRHLKPQIANELIGNENNEYNINKIPNFTRLGKKVVKLDNYLKHDNADRLPYFSAVLNNNILPNLTTSMATSSMATSSTSIRYSIELHDSNSYLDNDLDYSGVMVWARKTTDAKTVLIPDIYQYNNYLAKDSNKDTNVNKINKIGFYGTTTGSRNPKTNTRINTCIWAIDKKYIDCYITNVAQMSITDIIYNIKEWQQINHPRVEMSDLFKYKYLLDIPGNTYSWDRVPIILQSNSLLFKMPCTDQGWYYPLLHPGEHYVDVDISSMESKYMYYENNPKEAAFIIQNANRFVNSYLKPIHAYTYMVSLFEESDYWFGK